MGTLVPGAQQCDFNNKLILSTKVLPSQNKHLIDISANNVVIWCLKRIRVPFLAMTMKDKSMEKPPALEEVIPLCQVWGPGVSSSMVPGGNSVTQQGFEDSFCPHSQKHHVSGTLLLCGCCVSEVGGTRGMMSVLGKVLLGSNRCTNSHVANTNKWDTWPSVCSSICDGNL